MKDYQSHIPISIAHPTIPSPDMTTVFHARTYGRLTEIQSKLRTKKLHRMNQDSNFLGGSFSNRDNKKSPNPISIL